MRTKRLISTFATALALGFAAPVMAASENGIDCLADVGGQQSPGQGAKMLLEDGEGSQTKPGIGNLSKSFGGEGAIFQD